MLDCTTFILLICVLAIYGKPLEDTVQQARCGYYSCPAYDPNVINVHVVPHSHDDVGWLKTVNQYYDDDVRYILDTVIEALKANPQRKFIQVEVAFFKMWWEQQTAEIKQDVIKLVNNGQLEMINGAWSMNDEAASYYTSTIDQYTLGLRYLEDNLGPCARPRAGWQIDPFGHSREHASINAHLGYDSLFFSRIDYRDRDTRKAKKTQDFLWRATENLGNTSDIFTSVTFNHYSNPAGFCFDVWCDDEEIHDQVGSPNYNFEQRVLDFIYQVKERTDTYPTNNILMTMGDDFQYRSASRNYENLDKLIRGYEVFPQTYNGMPIKLYYSTPSCYAKAASQYLKNTGSSLEIKTDDFFPYADGPNTYWTGYFTSRPASKRFERQSNNLLQIIKQLGAAAGVPYSNVAITSLKEALGIMQHHDAITGTEKQHVTNNYHLLLSQAITNVNKEANTIIAQLIGKAQLTEPLGLTSCLLANVSYCPETNVNEFSVVIYNPLSRVVSSPVELPVNTGTWTIQDPEGKSVLHQTYPAVRDFSYLTEGRPSSLVLEFLAEDIPPLGLKTYTLRRVRLEAETVEVEATKAEETPNEPSIKPEKDDIVRIEHQAQKRAVPATQNPAIGYSDTNIHLDDNGYLRMIQMNGVAMDVSQQFLYYTSENSSGAYIFAPTDYDPVRIGQNTIKITRISGDVFEGVVQQFGDWATQTIKIYKGDRSFVEFDWILGPVSIQDRIGKEIITRFKTPLATGSVFYTDANGREMLRRVRNYRETYQYTNYEPVAGNYYPVNSRIALREENRRVSFAVITDRSEGGASLEDGEVEIMLHRACQEDDGRGVGENLNEQQYGRGIVVRGRYYVVLGLNTGDGERSIKAIEKSLAQRKNHEPWTFITPKDASPSLNRLEWSNLNSPLPENVNILTVESWKKNEILLRLEHVLESDDDESLSKEVTVDLTNLFASFAIIELAETTLAGNVPLEDLNRIQWSTDNDLTSKPDVLNVQHRTKRAANDLNITLAPMQIRTFIATVQYLE